MPPATGKRKSTDDAPDELHTPTGGPPTKKLRITHKQKQALMDNLQLEITERARKLRAQYALQANDLRSRIERRVNRIPVALRKANMGELLAKHTTAEKHGNACPRKVAPSKGARSLTTISVDPESSQTAAQRRAKKQSNDGVYEDKENAVAADGLNNPKRRGAAGGTSRVVSQKVRGPDSRILSPKSLNSKTYPHSPLRGSPDKFQSALARPVSPLKPSSPLRGTPSVADNSRPRTTKAGSTATKDGRPASQLKGATGRVAGGRTAVRSPVPRPATRQDERKLSTGTVSSTASSGTTVVKSTRAAATGARKPTTSTAAKKTTVAKNQAPVAAKGRPATRKATPAEAPGRRALRKRA